MGIVLRTTLKVPNESIEKLGEIGVENVEKYLQNCLNKYLTCDETKRFEFDALQEPTKKELDNAQQVLEGFQINKNKETSRFQFDELKELTTEEDKDAMEKAQKILSDFALNGNKKPVLFKFDRLYDK